jgi:hypothetical protein
MDAHWPGVGIHGPAARLYQASVPLRGSLGGEPLGRCRFESTPGELAPIVLGDVSEEGKGGDRLWTRA